MTTEQKLLEALNEKQREAVLHTEGPLLILAGAGSGKTRVLTHRIAWLIGRGVMPWQILAITFTNKAAGEMRERVDAMLGGSGADVWVSTFHSMCVRILRRDIERLGYERDFTIYDADDQRTLMKQVIKSLSLDPKSWRERAVLSQISAAKNEMKDAETFEAEASDFYEKTVAKLYHEYEKQLKKNNALDFDDLLLLTVKLFREHEEVLSGWQERFHYIMVDEYQDTNTVQFELVRMMSARYRNLCVVGDDDQSIYKFRGANIENILSFERSFPGAHVIKLEQNYRSSAQILAAANEVIRNNRHRKEKKLWTDRPAGEKPCFREYETAGAEADAVVRMALNAPYALKDQAVLYRTNAQSRLIEEKCIQRNVPYLIVGGVNFYQRKEIKDVLSYLRVTANGVDDLALERIINVPKRGIGQTTVERVRAYAAAKGCGMYEALFEAERIPGIGAAAASKIKGFVELIEGFRERTKNPETTVRELIAAVRDDTGYAEELRKEGEIEAETRLENIEELINKAASYEDGDRLGEESSLSGFLEEVSLIADLDRREESDDVLTLMTLHSAKGLEFDMVYLCGMEEGLFPSAAAINGDDPEAEIEEERRLCYVGITRARKQLFMTAAGERMIHGETHYEKPSRFIDELSEEVCDKTFLRRRAASWEDYDDDYDRPVPKRGFAGKCFSEGENQALYSGFSGGTTVYESYGAPAQPDPSAPNRLRSSGLYGSLDTSRKTGRGSGASFGKTFSVVQKVLPEYTVGDRVRHIKFGDGTVKELSEGAKDYEVTVEFDGFGIKRMFAGFAKLQKL